MKRYKVTVFLCSAILFMATLNSQAGSYFSNLADDFSEIFQLNVGYGFGLAANAKVTDALTLYAGDAHTQRWGLGLSQFEQWSEEEGGIPGFYGARITTASPETDERLSSQVKGIIDFADVDGVSKRAELGAERLNIEAGATFGIVSARVGFSLGQFADFLCTAVGYDLARDNGSARPKAKKTPAKKKPAPKATKVKPKKAQKKSDVKKTPAKDKKKAAGTKKKSPSTKIKVEDAEAEKAKANAAKAEAKKKADELAKAEADKKAKADAAKAEAKKKADELAKAEADKKAKAEAAKAEAKKKADELAKAEADKKAKAEAAKAEAKKKADELAKAEAEKKAKAEAAKAEAKKKADELATKAEAEKKAQSEAAKTVVKPAEKAAEPVVEPAK